MILIVISVVLLVVYIVIGTITVTTPMYQTSTQLLLY